MPRRRLTDRTDCNYCKYFRVEYFKERFSTYCEIHRLVEQDKLLSSEIVRNRAYPATDAIVSLHAWEWDFNEEGVCPYFERDLRDVEIDGDFGTLRREDWPWDERQP